MDERNDISYEIFGKPYSELTENEKEEVDNIINLRKREIMRREV